MTRLWFLRPKLPSDIEGDLNNYIGRFSIRAIIYAGDMLDASKSGPFDGRIRSHTPSIVLAIKRRGEASKCV